MLGIIKILNYYYFEGATDSLFYTTDGVEQYL